MPPRIGSNGAIVRPSLSTRGHQTARRIASQVVDLTDESPDGQAAVGGPNTKARQRATPHDQEYVLEDSFVVTSLHHRPWGAGDDNATIGVYPTEREALVAAESDYKLHVRGDGWEKELYRSPGGGLLQLLGRVDDGEEDSETYTASIQRVQQKRPGMAQPNASRAVSPKFKVVNPSSVFIVKEEQRMNLEEDDLHGLDEPGDLKSVEIHGVYADLDRANYSARDVYDATVEELNGSADTVMDKLKHGVFHDGLVTILVADPEEMMTYSIRVSEEPLQ